MADRSGKTSRKGAPRVPAQAPSSQPDARQVGAVGDRLPRLSPAQAAALRGLFASPQTWTLPGNGVLQFMPGRPASPAQAFELDAEGTRIGLGLQAPDTDAAVHWTDYSGRSRVLAWSLAHEASLVRLSDAFGVVLTPQVDVDAAAPAEADALWLDFIVDEDPGDDGASRMPSLQGALRAPPAWTDRLLERADPPYDDPVPLPARWRELGTTVSVLWRIPPLPWADWSRLRPGDVLVAGRQSRPPRAQACAAGLAWPIAPESGGWRIDGPPAPLPSAVQEASPMSDTPQDDGNPAAAPDGDALARRLPVDIAFELGRSELRIGELSALQPGYVFPLAAPVEGMNVTIRANGQAVGQGELVAVGDTLGVRLLSWT